MTDDCFLKTKSGMINVNHDLLEKINFNPYDFRSFSDKYKTGLLVFDRKLTEAEKGGKYPAQSEVYVATPDIGLRMEPMLITKLKAKEVSGHASKGYSADFANFGEIADAKKGEHTHKGTMGKLGVSNSMYFYLPPESSVAMAYRFTIADDGESLALLDNTFQNSVIVLDTVQASPRNDAGDYAVEAITAFGVEPVQESFREAFGLLEDEKLVSDSFGLGWAESTYDSVSFTVSRELDDGSSSSDSYASAPEPNQFYLEPGYEDTKSVTFSIANSDNYEVYIEADGLLAKRAGDAVTVSSFKLANNNASATVKVVLKGTNTVMLALKTIKKDYLPDPAPPTATPSPCPTAAPSPSPNPAITSTPAPSMSPTPSNTPTNTPPPTPAPIRKSIANAVKEKYIACDFTGGIFEDMRFKLTSKVTDSLLVYVPAGTVFQSTNSEIQDLMPVKYYEFFFPASKSPVALDVSMSMVCMNKALKMPEIQDAGIFKLVPAEPKPTDMGFAIADVLISDYPYESYYHYFFQSVAWHFTETNFPLEQVKNFVNAADYPAAEEAIKKIKARIAKK
jgi:hypothetical protein